MISIKEKKITEQQKQIMAETIDSIMEQVYAGAETFINTEPKEITDSDKVNFFSSFILHVLNVSAVMAHCHICKSDCALDIFEDWASSARERIQKYVNSEAVKEPV